MTVQASNLNNAQDGLKVNGKISRASSRGKFYDGLKVYGHWLRHVCFSGLKFGPTARAAIRDWHFVDCNFEASVFDGADIAGCNFEGCNLRRADFRYAHFTGVAYVEKCAMDEMLLPIDARFSFTHCDMRPLAAHLSTRNYGWTFSKGCNFSGMDMSRWRTTEMDFSRCVFRGAKLPKILTG